MLKLNIEKSWFDYHDTRCCNLAIQYVLPKRLPGPNLQFRFMKNWVHTSLLWSLDSVYIHSFKRNQSHGKCEKITGDSRLRAHLTYACSNLVRVYQQKLCRRNLPVHSSLSLSTTSIQCTAPLKSKHSCHGFAALIKPIMQRKVIQELKKTTFLIFLFIFLVPYLFVSKPVQQTIKQPKIKPSIIEKQLHGRFMVSRNTTNISSILFISSWWEDFEIM